MGGTKAVASGELNYGARVSLLLIADRPEAERRWREAAKRARCRVSAVVPLREAQGRLEAQLSTDVFVVDVAEDQEGLQPALDAVAGAAEARGCRALIAAPGDMIDRVAGAVGRPRVDFLIDGSAEERAAALWGAGPSPSPAMLNDVGRGQATARLQQLSEEVGRIASILAALSEDEVAAAAVAGIECGGEGAGERIEAAQIRAVIRARRLRDHFFNSELFADPAWDMLLDLMAARIEKQRVAVSSLCIAAAVPPTTALRWIKSLCDQGVFVRVADPEDGRRVFIELADSTAAAMENYFRAAQRVAALIV